MYYVYILRSINCPKQTYIGYTRNLKIRFENHNKGMVSHTRKFIPWKIETYIALSNKNLAINLEKYLKIGSGKAFLNKRLLISKI